MANTEYLKLVQCEGNEWKFVSLPNPEDKHVEAKFYFGGMQLDRHNDIAEIIYRNIADNNPYLIDAHSHLCIALRKQGKSDENLQVAEKTYNLAKSVIPEIFDIKKYELPWKYVDNRGFLNVCYMLIIEYRDRNQYQKAIDICNEMLRYNKSDDQGIKYLLLASIFSLKNYQKAEELINQYPDDNSIDFLYGKLILEILKDNEDVDTLLEQALECNELFPKEVLKTEHETPEFMGEFIPRGSNLESYIYWHNNKELYKNEKIVKFFKNKIVSKNS